MKPARAKACLLPLLLAAPYTLAQASSSRGVGHPEQTVRKLYHEVVKRTPLGIPSGSDQAAIWPFLSKRLIQQLEVTRACEADQMVHLKVEEEKLRREHPEQAKMIALKPATWDEDGLFSGPDEEGAPTAATVQKVKQQSEGSYIVYVKLAAKHMGGFSWSVAAVVTLEDRHYVVDDILQFEEDSTKVRLHLSDQLAAGCDGPKWIGYPDQADK